MNNENYLALLHKIGLNHKKLHIIFENNQNYKEFYNNLSSNILYTYGFTPKQIDFILKNKGKYEIASIERKLSERNVEIITKYNTKYPELLKNVFNSPFLFYLRGDINNSPKLSVVGSRNISLYGKNIITKLVGEISNYFTIVSGGAEGCDTFSHKIALENKNKTISVIGTGIDIDYPVKNGKLYNNIVESGGAIVSIFPIGEMGNPYNFPIRNEIVAGLSSGVLVIEAQKKSGTLITANLALDLGKDLFAVPGDIFKSNSLGVNNLIKNGMAKLVINSNDILEEYNISSKSGIKKIPLKFEDKIEEDIYNILFLESLNINELSLKLNMDIQNLSFKLSMMEINKIIKKGYGGKFEIF